jgi:hypothetical protein
MNWYDNYRKKSRYYMSLAAYKIYIPMILHCCFALFFISNLFSISYAIEPTIARQSIGDAPFDWIDIDTNTATEKGDPATDIVEVTYFIKDEILNSTLWLMFPFKELPVGYSIFNYGMLIDSDLREDTGPNGIDYQLEIRWDNETNTWTRVLTEWSTYAVGGRILNETKNFTGFSGDHLFYVSIPIELRDILNPNTFRVIYYAESQKEQGPLITDFTKWTSVPLPEIRLTTHPESIKLKQGEIKTVELIINSSTSPEPEVTLYSKNQSSSPILDIDTKNLTMPPDGFASVPITIKTSSDTEIAPHTISIYANSTFPALEFATFNTNSSSQFPIAISAIKDEDKITTLNLLVDVEEPLSLTDQISEFWNKLGEPLSFLYGVVAGLSPTIYSLLKKKLGK